MTDETSTSSHDALISRISLSTFHTNCSAHKLFCSSVPVSNRPRPCENLSLCIASAACRPTSTAFGCAGRVLFLLCPSLHEPASACHYTVQPSWPRPPEHPAH
ncbi:hypothetical protein BN1708_004417 [Verticillium longisporum]|uniref:Uncharacterized protein n=1 Tax=Verticillium longisporum TaxID=100787 RepID=A0A0G4LZU2_VERLO|nr:hypothetical protein BN1708_004417 [Verticillium longisporum]